jgi:rubrerythrin
MASDNGDSRRLQEIQNIVDFAIEKEKEAASFYTDLAGKVKLKALAKELRKIAAMEEAHRERLENLNVARSVEAMPKQVADLRIAEYVVENKPSPGMSWQDILNIAMHRELASINLYTDLEKLVGDPVAKRLFQNLAEEERGHKLFFEKIWDDEVLMSN